MRILYVTTSFPVFSETFLQREVRALLEQGAKLKIISLHGGKPDFEGHPIRQFSKWSLLKLIYLLPRAFLQKPIEMWSALCLLFTRMPRYSLNFFENLLGFGAAIVMQSEIEAFTPDLTHCVWSSAPGAFGFQNRILTGVPFSLGAHAYDIFEYGGDWLLEDKVKKSVLVHVSTRVAEERILNFTSPSKVTFVRRGLNELPVLKSMRKNRAHLRIVCIARLVEKKGFPYQLKIYEALKRNKVKFEALIIGDGPLSDEIEREVARMGLENEVILMGRLSETEVMDQLQWSDVLFHTGIVAASGDRDGLPNVVPEAMASGVIVVGSPVSGVVEAIEDGVTGFLCPPEHPEPWVDTCRRIILDDDLVLSMRNNARNWVEREFVARTNTGTLLKQMKVAVDLNSESAQLP